MAYVGLCSDHDRGVMGFMQGLFRFRHMGLGFRDF